MRSTLLALAITCSIIGVAQSAHAQGDVMQSSKLAPQRDIRCVVFHRPGPTWQPGKSLFEQQGVREHVEHYRKLLTAGKLALGGPHLDQQGGGMMITTSGTSEDEIRQFAAEDPAVKSGLLVYEVRPWLVGMSQGAK